MRELGLMEDPEVIAWLSWRDVRGTEPDLDEIRAMVTRVGRDWLLRSLSMIETLLTNTGMDESKQRALAAELLVGSDRERALELFDSGKVGAFVHPRGVMVAIKLALRYAAGATNAVHASLIGPVLLASNELASTWVGESLDDAASIAIRSSVLDLLEQPRYLLPRYHELLAERASVLADQIGLDIGALFEAASGGLSIADYLALTMVVYAVLRQFNRAQVFDEQNYGLAVADVARRALSPEVWEKYEQLMVTEVEAAAAVVAGDDEPGLTFEQFNSLRARPLVRLSNGDIVPVWLPWLLAKAGDGMRWTIQTALAGDGPAINQFTDALGSIFEDYAFALLARLYPDHGELQCLYPEIDYRRGGNVEQSNDATLFIGDSAFFFEFTITAPPSLILFNGDLEGYRAFIRSRFLREGTNQKLLKLERRISDFLSGELRFGPDYRQFVKRIFPVLVTLVPWPHHHVIARAIEPDFTPLVLLRGSAQGDITIDPWRLASIEEMEMLEGSLLAGDADIQSIFAGWASSRYFDSTLNNYLFLERPWREVQNPHLREKYLTITNGLKEGAARRVRLDPEGST